MDSPFEARLPAYVCVLENLNNTYAPLLCQNIVGKKSEWYAYEMTSETDGSPTGKERNELRCHEKRLRASTTLQSLPDTKPRLTWDRRWTDFAPSAFSMHLLYAHMHCVYCVGLCSPRSLLCRGFDRTPLPQSCTAVRSRVAVARRALPQQVPPPAHQTRAPLLSAARQVPPPPSPPLPALRPTTSTSASYALRNKKNIHFLGNDRLFEDHKTVYWN